MLDVLGPLGMRPHLLERACQANQGHYHNYDHVTFVDRGALRVYWKLREADEEQESRIFSAGDPVSNKVLIKAGVIHRIKAIEPNTHYTCVYTHRDFDGGEPVQEYNGNPAAYV